MAVNDPLGDMLTRIRNAQMRKRGKVSTPGSSLRQKVLDVLQAEGYIRGYSTTDYGNGRIDSFGFDEQTGDLRYRPEAAVLTGVTVPWSRVPSGWALAQTT